MIVNPIELPVGLFDSFAPRHAVRIYHSQSDNNGHPAGDGQAGDAGEGLCVLCLAKEIFGIEF